MRVLLRALSLAAVVSFAHAAVACPSGVTHESSRAEVTAPSTEFVLLNHEDDSPAASQSVVTGWSASPDWEQIEYLVSPAGFDGFDLSFKILVDDEGEPLMNVVSTGSLEKAAEEAPFVTPLALDGYEDR